MGMSIFQIESSQNLTPNSGEIIFHEITLKFGVLNYSDMGVRET